MFEDKQRGVIKNKQLDDGSWETNTIIDVVSCSPESYNKVTGLVSIFEIKRNDLNDNNIYTSGFTINDNYLSYKSYVFNGVYNFCIIINNFYIHKNIVYYMLTNREKQILERKNKIKNIITKIKNYDDN